MTSVIAARVWGGATAVIGAVMLARPRALAEWVGSSEATPNPVVLQVLGARQLVQGVALLVRPRQRLLVTGGSLVDASHGASMVAAAVVWPRYRRPALISAAIAGSSALAGALIGRKTLR